MARITVCIVVLLIGTSAFAEEPHMTQSVLPNLFATSPGLTLDLRFDYARELVIPNRGDSDFDAEFKVLHAFAHVQYVAAGGFGGYVSVPFGYAKREFADDGVYGIGNVELGGLFLANVTQSMKVLLRAGIAMDTTQEDDGGAIAISTSLPRPADAFVSGLQTSWGRVQAQMRYTNRNLELGAALGVDTPIGGEGPDDRIASLRRTMVSGIWSIGGRFGRPADDATDRVLGVAVSFTTLYPSSDPLLLQHSMPDGDPGIGVNIAIDIRLSKYARAIFYGSAAVDNGRSNTTLGLGLRSTLPL